MYKILRESRKDPFNVYSIDEDPVRAAHTYSFNYSSRVPFGAVDPFTITVTGTELES